MLNSTRRATFQNPLQPAVAWQGRRAFERCIECGCCIAGCGVANVNPDFVGAAGLNRIARFMRDPRDARSEDDWFEVVSDENGVFGCIGLMGCHDVCPKELPLLEQYAYLRRKMLGAAREEERT